MGSSFFGRPKMGGSSSSLSSTSSAPAKRGKNKNGSEKPKQPQRGLGVAQLEKIRLHGEVNCNSFNSPYPSYHPSTFNHQDDVSMQGGSYPSMSASSQSFSYASSSDPFGFHPNMMINAKDDRYGNSQHHIIPNWNPNYGILETQHFIEPNTTRHFLHEDPENKSLGSSFQNLETGCEANELDLELRLSL